MVAGLKRLSHATLARGLRALGMRGIRWRLGLCVKMAGSVRVAHRDPAGASSFLRNEKRWNSSYESTSMACETS